MNLLLSDAAQRPELFHWNGALDRAFLGAWLRDENLSVPSDLADFWAEVGGGDFFESETILSPFGDQRLGDDVKSANASHRERGLPPHLMLFHVGVTRTAIEQPTLRYVSLDESNQPTESFVSLNAWYYSIRQPFAETYGLTKLPVIR